MVSMHVARLAPSHPAQWTCRGSPPSAGAPRVRGNKVLPVCLSSHPCCLALPPCLQDRPVIIIANLKPRNMRGIKSHGMVLCASNEEHTEVGLGWAGYCSIATSLSGRTKNASLGSGVESRAPLPPCCPSLLGI